MINTFLGFRVTILQNHLLDPSRTMCFWNWNYAGSNQVGESYDDCTRMHVWKGLVSYCLLLCSCLNWVNAGQYLLHWGFGIRIPLVVLQSYVLPWSYLQPWSWYFWQVKTTLYIILQNRDILRVDTWTLVRLSLWSTHCSWHTDPPTLWPSKDKNKLFRGKYRWFSGTKTRIFTAWRACLWMGSTTAQWISSAFHVFFPSRWMIFGQSLTNPNHVNLITIPWNPPNPI